MQQQDLGEWAWMSDIRVACCSTVLDSDILFASQRDDCQVPGNNVFVEKRWKKSFEVMTNLFWSNWNALLHYPLPVWHADPFRGRLYKFKGVNTWHSGFLIPRLYSIFLEQRSIVEQVRFFRCEEQSMMMYSYHRLWHSMIVVVRICYDKLQRGQWQCQLILYWSTLVLWVEIAL